MTTRINPTRFRSVVAITADSDSVNPGSIPGETFIFHLISVFLFFKIYIFPSDKNSGIADVSCAIYIRLCTDVLRVVRRRRGRSSAPEQERYSLQTPMLDRSMRRRHALLAAGQYTSWT